MIMKKAILFLISVLMIISCEKNETEDLLVKGTWILDNGLTAVVKESVKFNPDKTYIIESGLRTPRTGYFISGTISGEWSRQDDKIIFHTSFLILPDDTSSINIIPATPGVPVGAFYGHIYSGIYQRDSSLVDSLGFIRFDEINNAGIFKGDSLDERIWLIHKLTTDSLIVENNGEMLGYLKE
jgi:hypothetical protein